ncbi:MAG: TonB family protein [Steroidobacteraceae bacterium]
MDALRFSLASDIVELVVLTVDELFLQTLREAVGASRRLWHVPSADKVSDLLVAGGVGILVLDVQALREAATVFITQIKREFPDLVIVVAGNREAETALAGQISDGIVYRFIHKPMSPGRARLFADAAVKKYDEQRRRAGGSVAAGAAADNHGLLMIAGACAALCVLLIAIWLLRHGSREESPQHAVNAAAPPPAAPPPAASPPAGSAAAESPLGLAEVQERLLARAENALLEERLNEASVAIETARNAGVDSGRIAFLTAQLAKARERLKAPPASTRVKDGGGLGEERPAADAADPLAALAVQRINEGHLIDPDRDNARFYVQEALRADPNSSAAQQAEEALALSLLTAVRGAIDRRDFALASSWLEAASGIAAPANIDNLQQSLVAARRQADTDGWDQLLKSAEERLQQDRLIEPANDSAKYYLTTLRGADPTHAGLAAATQDLGARLVAKGRRALSLEQYDAARGWLDEAAAIGYSSPDAAAALRDLDAALAHQKFLANVVAANALVLEKSVQPAYPRKARQSAIEGWVEMDFTVAETGEVKDVAVLAANPPGVFEQAAVSALSQWRYKPVLHDAKPTAQRARIRVRFALAN